MIVGLVGLGNLGSAIANLAANNGHPVIGWEYNSEVVDEINQAHTNAAYLPGIDLSPDIEATTDLSRVWQETSLVFIALPSVFIERTLAPGRSLVPTSTIIVEPGTSERPGARVRSMKTDGRAMNTRDASCQTRDKSVVASMSGERSMPGR